MIYKSPEGEAKFIELYESRLARLSRIGIKCESRMMDTRFGPTHILITGPEDAPPLVVLHGIHASGPFGLEVLLPLTKNYRVYLPDVIGQPGRSAKTLISPLGNNYAKWLVDVLDGLGLERAVFAGISFGGGILLDLAAYAPERISGAVLIVPAGIASASSPQLLLHLFAPWSLYRFIPSRNRLIRVLRPLMSEFEEPVLEFFDTIIRHVNWIQIPPGPFTIEDLKCFAAPTLLFLSKEDIFVPFDQAYIWSKQIIPNLTAIEILDGPHIPTRKMLAYISERIQGFLAER